MSDIEDLIRMVVFGIIAIAVLVTIASALLSSNYAPAQQMGGSIILGIILAIFLAVVAIAKKVNG